MCVHISVCELSSLYKLWVGLLHVCVHMCVCVCEVLAVTWQSGQGGAARGLLIIVGGAVCVYERARESETEKETACVREKGRKTEMKSRR